jgi:phytoene synthase
VRRYILAAMHDVFAHCENVVRAADKDRFLATLFARADRRGGLFALYAFDAEVAGVRVKIREPLAGELRLQWWHDAVSGSGETGGNPVAVALVETMRSYELPTQRLLDLIDARRSDLYDDPIATLAELESHARNTASAVIALAMRILDRPDAAALGLAGSAGVGQALTALLRSFAWDAAHGKIYLPEEISRRHGAERADILAGRAAAGLGAALAELRTEARRLLAADADAAAHLPAALVPAVLPAALAHLYLARMERADYAPFRTPVEVPQWRKQWRLWRAARNPRRIATG